jgi:hypothetical protein
MIQESVYRIKQIAVRPGDIVGSRQCLRSYEHCLAMLGTVELTSNGRTMTAVIDESNHILPVNAYRNANVDLVELRQKEVRSGYAGDNYQMELVL